ncbi:MAG TPA: isochorismatase family cysteine hydrolase [Bryobacteraceae bacterium]|jgi:nicotinamidase/pyrazinamidase|nr:isochorismatase family cysteine hydrolase [Bryobacteraceae bacterium]
MKTVFFDVDTQLDFVYPSGSLYVPRAERIVPVIAHLNRTAAERGIPVISTVDAHAEDDPEFRQWPHHCVAGTLGQRKPESTLFDRRVVVPNREHHLSLDGARQIILEKQTLNAFDAPNLARVLYHLAADRYVVYGVVTEICVHHAVRGLLKLAKPVAIVTDAIAGLQAQQTRESLSEMQASGVQLLTSAALCDA